MAYGLWRSETTFAPTYLYREQVLFSLLAQLMKSLSGKALQGMWLAEVTFFALIQIDIISPSHAVGSQVWLARTRK